MKKSVCFFCLILLVISTSNHAIMIQKPSKNYCRTCTSQLTIIAQRKLHRSFCKKRDDVFEESATVATKHSNKSIFKHGKIDTDDDNVTSNIQVNNVKKPTEDFTSLLAGLVLTLCLYQLTKQVNIASSLEYAVATIEQMGPLGYVYFSGIYILAEVLAVPALPLTASSGYLFGLLPGFLTVLVSATVAAGISFLIGRTYLRDWAQMLARKYGGNKWDVIDKAVSKEGFKVVLLLRLSPLLPFALSNYLYGITSVEFWQFICGTCLGFSPGTFGIVYAGTAGRDLLSESNGFSWYFYVLGAIVAATIGKIITDVASAALEDVSNDSKDIDNTSF